MGFIDPISLLFQDLNAGYNALMYDSFIKCRSRKPQLSATVAGYPVTAFILFLFHSTFNSNLNQKGI